MNLRPGGGVGHEAVVCAVDEEGDADVDAVGRGVAVLAEAIPLLANPDLLSIDQRYLTDDRILQRKNKKVNKNDVIYRRS